MTYTVDFCIVSLAFLMVTVIFYSRQVKVPSTRNTLFAALLVCGVVSLVFDIAAAAENPYAHLLPSALVYAVNIVFLASVQLSGVLFFFYTMSLTDAYAESTRGQRLCVCIPFILVCGALLLSPFLGEHSVFYLDANNIYLHGSLHLSLYIVMAFYLLSAVLVLFWHRKNVQTSEIVCVAGFIGVTLAAMLVQMSHPYLLVNSMANALALSLIYYILEAPGMYVDAMTGVFNRAAFPQLLNALYARGTRFTLLLFPLHAFHLINHTLGMKNGDRVLVDFSAYLKRTFPKGYCLRLAGIVFGVLLPGGKAVTREELMALYDTIPHEFLADKLRVHLDMSLVGVNSENVASAEDFVALLESILALEREESLPDVLLADKALKQRLHDRKALELALARALDNDGLEVYYQPIHNCDKKLVALEALVRLSDPEYGPLPTQEAVELAEQNGSIGKLGLQVLHKVCRFITDNNAAEWGLDHIGVNLSAIQCMQPDLADVILRTCQQYNTPPSLLAFEITETATGSLDMLRLHMECLCAAGYFFLLDDFGKGYANISHIALLPFHCAKIDKALLWEGMSNPDKRTLLKGVAGIFNDLGLLSVCEGVETAEQLALLKEYGVSMLQGYYFSKPLSPAALLDYVKKQEAGV